MRRTGVALALIALLLVGSSAAMSQTVAMEGETLLNQTKPASRFIRLAVVRTPVDAGLLNMLIESFQKRAGYSVQV